MKKVIHPCDVKDYNNRHYPMFCKIEIKNGRLSITGVIGPTRGGNAHGGCGQIDMEFAHRNPAHDDKRYSTPTPASELRFALGWDVEKWYTFLEVWHDWHLNDMRPGCEHQTGEAWTAKDVTLYHFNLTQSAQEAKREARDAAKAALVKGETFTPSANQTYFAGLPYSITLPTPEAPKDYQPTLKTSYSSPSEVKSTGWLHENEHPDGFLGKACPVCGYKYGTAWRTVDLPAEVIAFLKSLPDTDRTPNWV